MTVLARPPTALVGRHTSDLVCHEEIDKLGLPGLVETGSSDHSYNAPGSQMPSLRVALRLLWADNAQRLSGSAAQRLAIKNGR